MSSGGIFGLITSNGGSMQDQMLRADELLRDRIRVIKAEAAANHEKGINSDSYWNWYMDKINASHTAPIGGFFKPFVSTMNEYIKVKAEGTPTFGGKIIFPIPQSGHFYSDSVVHLRLTGLSAVSPLDKVRYCAMPGHKIFKNVCFEVSNIPVDTYVSEEYNAHYQFKLPPSKRVGWLRQIGQEIPTIGYITPDPLVNEYREYRYIGYGNQTFKRSHPVVDLWIPLLFWFKNQGQAIPSLCVPYGQTFIKIDVAKVADMVSFTNYGGGGAYTEPVIQVCELYINNIFVNQEISDLFLPRSGLTMIRSHVRHTKILTVPDNSEKLHGLKWPIENMYFNFRPLANLSNSQNWYKSTTLSLVEIPTPVVAGVVPTILINNIILYSESPVVNAVSLEAFGISFYKEISEVFFNSYVPYNASFNISTPLDLGWYMISFCPDSSTNNPTGYLNTSRLRELSLNYTSSTISTSNPVELFVTADAINFIVVRNGTIMLKFAT